MKQIIEEKYRNDKSQNKNLSDPTKWYANNCIFRPESLKYNFSEFIEEGDKTIVPFKYFLLDFLKHKEINDIEFFFNQRDFPVLKHNYEEPYEQIFGTQKIEEEYQIPSYTPILSQSGNINYQDIPIPTEDDMKRLTNKIHPDKCDNPYQTKINFEMDFDKKKPICVFRGSATGCGITIDTNMRLKAAQLSYEWNKKGKKILDAKLTGLNRKPKIYDGQFDTIHQKFKFKIGKKNFMNLEEQSKCKYILNIDGHVKAFRVSNELRMGSVVLLVDSPYT